MSSGDSTTGLNSRGKKKFQIQDIQDFRLQISSQTFRLSARGFNLKSKISKISNLKSPSGLPGWYACPAHFGIAEHGKPCRNAPFCMLEFKNPCKIGCF